MGNIQRNWENNRWKVWGNEGNMQGIAAKGVSDPLSFQAASYIAE